MCCSLSKCCKCITCNKGPKCVDWTLRRIRYSKWTLSWQMFMGVCMSVVCVLTTMAICMTAFAYSIMRDAELEFFDALTIRENELLISRSIMASEQIQSFTDANEYKINKAREIIEEALDRTMLGDQYPISAEGVTPVTFEEISDDRKVERDGELQSFQHMSYSWARANRSDSAWNFAVQMFMIEGYLKELESAQLGLQGNSNPERIILRYWDPDDICVLIRLDYPAIAYCLDGDCVEDFDCDESMYDKLYLHAYLADLSYENGATIVVFEGTGIIGASASISIVAPFRENGKFAGSVEARYEISELSKLISPLYEGLEGFNLWVFSEFLDIGSNVIQPLNYQDPLYWTGDVEIDPDVFNDLIENIYVDEVVEFQVGERTQVFYSQAMPPDTDGDRSKIQFYLLFMIDKEDLFANEYKEQIERSSNLTMLLIMFIVSSGFFISLSVMILLTCRTSRRITRTIDIMTTYTAELRQASYVADKKEIIDKISKDPAFLKISRQYDEMQRAQDALLRRYERQQAVGLSTCQLKNFNQANARRRTSSFHHVLAAQNSAQHQEEIKPIKPGTEVSKINKWNELQDELEELQKIFFEFLKRWTNVDRGLKDPNIQLTYAKFSDEEPFELENECKTVFTPENELNHPLTQKSNLDSQINLDKNLFARSKTGNLDRLASRRDRQALMAKRKNKFSEDYQRYQSIQQQPIQRGHTRNDSRLSIDRSHTKDQYRSQQQQIRSQNTKLQPSFEAQQKRQGDYTSHKGRQRRPPAEPSDIVSRNFYSINERESLEQLNECLLINEQAEQMQAKPHASKRYRKSRAEVSFDQSDTRAYWTRQ